MWISVELHVVCNYIINTSCLKSSFSLSLYLRNHEFAHTDNLTNSIPSANNFSDCLDRYFWTSAPVSSAMCCATWCGATTLSHYQLVQAYHTTTLIPDKPCWMTVCRADLLKTAYSPVRFGLNATYSMYHNTNLYTTTCSQQQDSRTGKGTNHTPTDWSLTRVGGFRSRGLGVESLRSTAHNVATGFFVSTCGRGTKGNERWRTSNFSRLVEHRGLIVKEA